MLVFEEIQGSQDPMDSLGHQVHLAHPVQEEILVLLVLLDLLDRLEMLDRLEILAKMVCRVSLEWQERLANREVLDLRDHEVSLVLEVVSVQLDCQDQRVRKVIPEQPGQLDQ